MKILILNGGPHKGNTWLLTQKVRQFIERFDDTAEFSELHLSDVDLPFCTGCSNCFRKGHDLCPHNKKMQPVMDKIEESDAVIFCVPCFQGHLPGILKNFTDHMAFMLHRPRYFTKKALIISTTGGVSAGSTTKALAATLGGWGFNKCYQLPVTAFSWNAYKPTRKDLVKAYAVTKQFYLDVKSGKMHVPGIGALIPFNLFQAMCGEDKAPQYPTRDNDFWKKYVGMRYAPGIPLTPVHRAAGKLFCFIGRRIGSSVAISYKR